MDFLADSNQCGQQLLKLVAKGNSVVAEMLHLKDSVPTVYRNPSKRDLARYKELVGLDFTYFKQGGSSPEQEDKFERGVEANEALAAADEELKETFGGLLKRFYSLFEGIRAYSKDLQAFVAEVESGSFIQGRSLEAVFLDEDGRQLLCEAVYVMGVMLLLVDTYLEGPVREKLLVAHYRYSGSEKHFDEVCKLLRSTGFLPGAATRRPPNYPELFFSRVQFPPKLIRLVLGALRSDDVYNQLAFYPNPDHRPAALSQQAALLYVALLFAPDVLHDDNTTMREIVDKFFPDNWVVSFHMGVTVNLIEAWDGYKAAKAALSNTLQSATVKRIAAKAGAELQRLLPLVSKAQMEGALSEEIASDDSMKLLGLVCECNVAIRWSMLHSSPLRNSLEANNKRCKQVRDVVLQELRFGDGSDLFALLLNTAQFEFLLRRAFKEVLDGRESKWEAFKAEACASLKELADLCNVGAKGLAKSKNLERWFNQLEKQVQDLDLQDVAHSTGMAAKAINALSQAEDLDQLGKSWQVKQLMSDTKSSLQQMARVGAANEKLLITLEIVSDFSYAWGENIEGYTSHMQAGVRLDPTSVSKLRSIFLKLSSAMEQPMIRIGQAKCKDMMVSVSHFYSGELVAYVRKVLQIIPKSLIEVLAKIVELQTDTIEELPTRLEKDQLRDLAQLSDRFKVAKYTHLISVFTEGMLSMKATLVGVIKVDPKKLLIDGIRRETVKQITRAFHEGLNFSTKGGNIGDLLARLERLSKVMSGHQRSFEYISDYIGISGLGVRIWHSELSRIFGFFVEQEANPMLKSKVLPAESRFQSREVPIPLYLTNSINSGEHHHVFGLTFMGRLASELLAQTNPKTTVFVPARQAWYNARTQEEVVPVMKLFPLLEAAIGVHGIAGLDRLLALRAKHVCLQRQIFNYSTANIFKDKSWVDMLDNLADSLANGSIMAAPHRFYHQQHVARAERPLTSLVEAVVDLGHIQLMRKSICFQLSRSSKFEGKLFRSSLATLNRSAVNEVKEHLGSEVDSKNLLLLARLKPWLANVGLVDPGMQIYVEVRSTPRLPELVFLLILCGLAKLTFSPCAGDLVSKKTRGGCLDGHPFTLGVSCLLRQCPEPVSVAVVEYLAQFIRSFINEQTRDAKCQELSGDVVNAVFFLDRLLYEDRRPRGWITQLLPPGVIDLMSFPQE